jgi:putative NADPH-quinone reductase
MKILIVYAHPESTSFNHALKEQAIDIKEEQDKLLWCDIIIFQFPLW